MRGKNSFADTLTVALTSAVILFLGAGLLISPKSDFSELENRPVASVAPLTAKSLFDGSFFASLSDCCSDGFPCRDGFTRIKALCEICLMKRQNNGIYFGDDGYLIPVTENNERVTEDNLDLLTELYAVSGNTPFVFLPVPTASDVMSHKIGLGGDLGSADVWTAVNSVSLPKVDVTCALAREAASGGYVWYKTDHHWTTKGAYIAYSALGDALSYTPLGEDKFTVETASCDFLGSSYSRIGGLALSSDTVELYRYSGDTSLSVYSYETGKTTLGLYRSEMTKTGDKYAVFLGGNYSRLRITNANKGGRKTLLVIKDSYANALLPFLALHYDLDVIDPRYYEGSIADAIGDADAVLAVVGIGTLCSTPLR